MLDPLDSVAAATTRRHELIVRTNDSLVRARGETAGLRGARATVAPGGQFKSEEVRRRVGQCDGQGLGLAWCVCQSVGKSDAEASAAAVNSCSDVTCSTGHAGPVSGRHRNGGGRPERKTPGRNRNKGSNGGNQDQARSFSQLFLLCSHGC